ncbi:hypothetical protein GMDG_02664 [Pseudogymnoascus destructans 20631-21]|uniref:Uncharacterized protein n=1 Tax=Pseudogymnoascus destructans (strain ATCC MYA-4855 / 20631-21) TaxID=658429 RepID=L8G6P3_PSED2|nr:hypothetical protein GMDG_02664 [Pseudogymnoascus destructans 20631-21]
MVFHISARKTRLGSLYHLHICRLLPLTSLTTIPASCRRKLHIQSPILLQGPIAAVFPPFGVPFLQDLTFPSLCTTYTHRSPASFLYPPGEYASRFLLHPRPIVAVPKQREDKQSYLTVSILPLTRRTTMLGCSALGITFCVQPPHYYLAANACLGDPERGLPFSVLFFLGEGWVGGDAFVSGLWRHLWMDGVLLWMVVCRAGVGDGDGWISFTSRVTSIVWGGVDYLLD